MSENKDFKWTDKDVRDFSEFYRINQGVPYYWGKDILEIFKRSKQPPIQEKEKDYEILSFRHKNLISVWSKIDNGKFEASFSNPYRRTISPLSFFLRNLDSYEIYSVKRLSDNEEFKLDEKFTANAGCDLTIKSFEISGNTINVWSKEYGYWQLSQIEKVKPKLPLFTTEDGIPLYKGDTYYTVFFKSSIGCFTPVWKLNSDIAEPITDPDTTWSKDCKFFYNKEKAEQYILFNKPVSLSLKEIHDHLTFNGGILIEKLTNLFKSKINF